MRLVLVAFWVWSGGMACLTAQRVTIWTSETALWADAVAKAPGKPRPLVNLARQADLQHDLATAERLYRAAVTISHDSRRPPRSQRHVRAAAQTNLAHVLMKRGDAASAMRLLDSILAEWPTYPYAHFNRGYILRAYGLCDEAIKEYEMALAGDPTLVLPSPLCLDS